MRPSPVSSAQYLRDICEALAEGKRLRVCTEKFSVGTRHHFARLWKVVRAATIGFVIVFWVVLLCWGALAGVHWWLNQGIPVVGMTISEELAPDRIANYVVGQWYNEILPDGTNVRARYMGKLGPNQVVVAPAICDEWYYRGHLWIWMVPFGASVPQWVDP